MKWNPDPVLTSLRNAKSAKVYPSSRIEKVPLKLINFKRFFSFVILERKQGSGTLRYCFLQRPRRPVSHKRIILSRSYVRINEMKMVKGICLLFVDTCWIWTVQWQCECSENIYETFFAYCHAAPSSFLKIFVHIRHHNTGRLRDFLLLETIVKIVCKWTLRWRRHDHHLLLVWCSQLFWNNENAGYDSSFGPRNVRCRYLQSDSSVHQRMLRPYLLQRRLKIYRKYLINCCPFVDYDVHSWLAWQIVKRVNKGHSIRRRHKWNQDGTVAVNNHERRQTPRRCYETDRQPLRITDSTCFDMFRV